MSLADLGIVDYRYGRRKCFLVDDMVAYQEKLEELSRTSEKEADYLVKREEYDTQMVEHTKAVMEVRVATML